MAARKYEVVDIDLPKSTVDLLSLVKPWPGNAQTLAPKEKDSLPYVLPSLKLGRPLDKCMIMTAGVTGSGKSTTINSLFQDQSLCLTGDFQSVTTNVVEFVKDLRIKTDQGVLNSQISAVDVPGTFDTDPKTEAANAEALRQWVKTCPSLLKKPKTRLYPDMRDTVYPNVLLYVVNLADKRMGGQQSTLTSSLRRLQKANLVDSKHQNLIVVGTHAFTLGTRREVYSRNSERKKEILRQVVSSVFEDYYDVPLVFIENQPQDFLEPDGDFYRLPDGSRNILNLFDEIVLMLEKSSDTLGQLVASFYFRDDSHKTIPARLGHQVTKKSNKRQAETEEWTDELQETGNPVPLMTFEYLCRGYCPRSQRSRAAINIVNNNLARQEAVLGNSFRLPHYIEVWNREEYEFNSWTTESAEEYSKVLANTFGLEADLPLLVTATFEGKWSENSDQVRRSANYQFVYEVRKAKLKVDENRLLRDRLLTNDLDQLPDEYDESTARQFSNFFAKWGSHFVSQVYLGGIIKIDCSVSQDLQSSHNFRAVGARIRSTFVNLQNGANFSHEKTQSSLTESGLLDEQIKISGGRPPPVRQISDLTTEQFHGWVESLNDSSSEIPYSLQLTPYYALVPGDKRDALRDATFKYCNGSMASTALQPADNRTRKQAGLMAQHAAQQRATASAKNIEDSNCFPADASVRTAAGMKTIAQLTDGDSVLTVGATMKLQFTQFITYLHFDRKKVCRFLLLRLANGARLRVTSDHILFAVSGGKPVATKAGCVQTGDCVLYSDLNEARGSVETVQVQSVSAYVAEGVYAPLVYDGTLLVDGVYASCYASLGRIGQHSVMHAMCVPLRMAHHVRKVYSKGKLATWLTFPNTKPLAQVSTQQDEDSGLHPFATLRNSRLFRFIKLFVPQT